MIIAKEITKLVESTTQESTKEKLDRFVSLITPHALGLNINHVIVVDKAVIFADLSIFNKKDVGKLSKPQITNKISLVIERILLELGGKSGHGVFTSLAPVLGINKKLRRSTSSISVYYPQTKSMLVISGTNPVPDSSVRVELSFPENVLDLETLYTPRFVEVVGNLLFGQFLLAISNYRTEQIFGDEFLSIKDKLVSGVNKGFGREVKSLGTKDTQPRIYLFYDFPVKKLTDKSSNPGVLTDFMTEVKSKIDYPLKELHKISRPMTSENTDGVFHFNCNSSMFYIVVILSDSESTGEAATYTTDVGRPKPGCIRVFCGLVKFEELEFVSETGLDDLIDVISSIFVNYNKLINNFNNRPTKKTNADW